MNRRQVIRTLTLTALGTGSCLSSDTEIGNPTVAIRITKPISIGQTLLFDNYLSITFSSLLYDKRCPINAKCTSEGNAEVKLRIKVGKDAAKNYWLHTSYRPRKLQIPWMNPVNGAVKTYVIDIATLDPLPYAGKKFPRSEYKVSFHIAEVI